MLLKRTRIKNSPFSTTPRLLDSTTAAGLRIPRQNNANFNTELMTPANIQLPEVVSGADGFLSELWVPEGTATQRV